MLCLETGEGFSQIGSRNERMLGIEQEKNDDLLARVKDRTPDNIESIIQVVVEEIEQILAKNDGLVFLECLQCGSARSGHEEDRLQRGQKAHDSDVNRGVEILEGYG